MKTLFFENLKNVFIADFSAVMQLVFISLSKSTVPNSVIILSTFYKH